MTRVTNERAELVLAVAMLGLATNGCAAVLEAAAKEPAALALLPVAGAIEMIGQAARAGSKEDRDPAPSGMISIAPGGGAIPAPLQYRHWKDPDDWVAACEGPILCGDHEHHACEGRPGDCYCDCVGDFVTPKTKVATRDRKRRRSTAR